MTFRGSIVSIYPDIMLDQVFIQLETTKACLEALQAVREVKDLDIDIKRHREKRSLNSNAYFHVLCGKIANKLGITPTEVKNQMLRDYGFIDEDVKTIILRDDVNYLRLEELHLRPIEGQRKQLGKYFYQVYYVIRGSHTYNTEEMSKLIDGTVSEAKDLGIETLTPDELKAMTERWCVELGSGSGKEV